MWSRIPSACVRSIWRCSMADAAQDNEPVSVAALWKTHKSKLRMKPMDTFLPPVEKSAGLMMKLVFVMKRVELEHRSFDPFGDRREEMCTIFDKTGNWSTARFLRADGRSFGQGLIQQQGYPHALLHSDCHIAHHRGLFLHGHASRSRARQVQREASGNDRQS